MSFTSDPQPFHRLYVGGGRSATNAVVARDTLDAAVPVASHPAGKPGLPPAAWPAPGDPCWELVTLTRDELAALANSLDGHVVFPGLHGYQDGRSATEVHFPTPRVIAVCMTKRDVATCLQWITQHDWLLSIRSGGHNGAGFHLCNGLTLDLQNLDQMDYDVNCGEVTIGAGAKWKDIGAFLANKPGFLPGGTCGLVGAAGYTQGGGYSMVSRIFGLTCDLLVSAQVMLADGSEVTASAKENSDLFWALRGGGGGQFGVLLSMTFRLISPDQFFGFVLNWRLPDAAQALSTSRNTTR